MINFTYYFTSRIRWCFLHFPSRCLCSFLILKLYRCAFWNFRYFQGEIYLILKGEKYHSIKLLILSLYIMCMLIMV